MRPIELSPRLRTVAEQVPQGTRFADVGTDHAYLPVWLLQRGIISSAVVSDLHEGPLDRAKQTAGKYGLTSFMSFRLGNGLRPIKPDETDTIAIAGMGGETIIDILADAPWTKEGTYQLILQPMSALDKLRGWLQPNGYRIDRELLCQDSGSRYTILLAMPGYMEPLSPAECWAGRQVHGEGGRLRGELLESLLLRAERALAGIQQSTRLSDVPRCVELERAYDGLKQMKEEWDTWQQ